MGSIDADQGTAAHSLGEQCLRDGSMAADHVGESITIQHYKHHKLSASSAHRWLVCPGSVETADQDVQEGPGTTWVVSEEMAEAVQLYLDVVRQALKDLPGSTLQVEQNFELYDLHPDMGGSCDAIVTQPMGTIKVFDFKYGMKPVEAEDNAQLKFYSVGGIRSAWDPEIVEVVIVQPRAFHKDGPVRSWKTTPESLVKFGDGELKVKAAEAFGKNPKRVAGDHCKFCPKAAGCQTLREHVTNTAMTMFNPVNGASKSPALVSPTQLTSEQLGRTLGFADMVKTWIKAVEDEADARAQRGDLPLGYKLVETVGHRKWRDEKEVVATVKDPAILYASPELRSPAQLEKALKAAKVKIDLSSLTMQKSGTSLVPVADPRPAHQKLAFTDTTAFKD